MPLIESSKKKNVGKNIAMEMEAGKPQKQSIAIALDIQRKNKGKKKMAKGGAALDASDSNSVGGDPHPSNYSGKYAKGGMARKNMDDGGAVDIRTQDQKDADDDAHHFGYKNDADRMAHQQDNTPSSAPSSKPSSSSSAPSSAGKPDAFQAAGVAIANRHKQALMQNKGGMQTKHFDNGGAITEDRYYPDRTSYDATNMAKGDRPNYDDGGPITGNSNAPWDERVASPDLTYKPNMPRNSHDSYESKSLDDRAPEKGSSPAQMAEYYEQLGAKYRMMANGGAISKENYPYEMNKSLANGGPVENANTPNLEGSAQADRNPGAKPRVPNDTRFPEGQYMGKDWSYGDPPASKPDDERPSKDEYDEGYRAGYADGGQITFRDDKSKDGKGGNVYTREPGQPAPKPDDKRIPRNDYNAEAWAAGEDPAVKPDDKRPPKSQYLNTNYWYKGGEINPSLSMSKATMNEPDARQTTDAAMKKKVMAKGGAIEERDDTIPSPSVIVSAIMKGRKTMEGREMNKGGKAAYASGGKINRVQDGDTEDDLAPMDMKGREDPEEDQVDIDRNAREDQNHEDDLSYNSLNRENYSEQDGLNQMGSPEDSNETGDEEEKDSENKHDMVGKIRKGMRMRKVGQLYNE